MHFSSVEGPQWKCKLYRHVLCYPADSKDDSDIFNILISPISNFLFIYLFLFQLPNRKFFLLANKYLLTYLLVKASITLHKIARKQRAQTLSSHKKLFSLRQIMNIWPNLKFWFLY